MLKVMTYNIWKGFHDKNNNPENQRLEAAKRIVASQSPDILILTEACFALPNSAGITMDYPSLFSYPYSSAINHPEDKRGPKDDFWATAMLSRLPMETRHFSLGSKNAIRAVVNYNGKRIAVDAVHFTPRTSQLDRTTSLESALHEQGFPDVLAGDFNALSPDDAYHLATLTEELTRNGNSHTKSQIHAMLKRDLISWVKANGFVDTARIDKRCSTMPTRAAYGENVNGIRIDYIFAKRKMNPIDGYVVKGEDVEVASDHRPVVAVFK